MGKISYFRNAGDSVILMLKNPVLYLPDIIYYAATAVFAYLFLYLNNLTVIFSGLDFFTSRIRDIADTSNLLWKLIISFSVFVILNFIVGLGTISLRYVLVKQIIENNKINFVQAYKKAGSYIFSVLFLKILLLIIYLIPIAVFGFIGITYKVLIIPMILLAIISLIILRLVFLFVYPILFLKTEEGAVKTIKYSYGYFNKKVVHTLLTGLFIFIVGFIVRFLSNKLLESYAAFPFAFFGVILIILINISLIIWGAVFLFKNI